MKNIHVKSIVPQNITGWAVRNASKLSEIGRPIVLHNLFQAGSRQIGIELSASLFLDLIDPYKETSDASAVRLLASGAFVPAPASKTFCA